jgi:hypothetical protein
MTFYSVGSVERNKERNKPYKTILPHSAIFPDKCFDQTGRRSPR